MIANPHLIVERDYRSLSQAAARFVGRQVLLKEDSVLGMPTGETPRGMYEELVRLCLEGVLDLSSVTLFNLDEYLGLPPEHPSSFRSYMQKHFLEILHLNEMQFHIPHSSPTDPQQECHRYEAAIGEAGGLDLVVLGLGRNGHIAFNEPGTPWELGTHVAELLPETRRRAA
ncbi:MAG: glucosamine-6-phosphate deaminase, partial [Chloroflexi bacterium]|nr:glucosamine-6-phosphate deaminase [Chloroflexota bacterium]